MSNEFRKKYEFGVTSELHAKIQIEGLTNACEFFLFVATNSHA